MAGKDRLRADRTSLETARKTASQNSKLHGFLARVRTGENTPLRHAVLAPHSFMTPGGHSLNVPHDEHFDWPLRFLEFQPKLMGQVKSSLRLRQLTRCR